MEDLKNRMVYAYKGELVTDSQSVAEYFGRQHKNILKSIRRLIGHGMENHFRDLDGGKHPHFIMDAQGFDMLTKTLPNCDEKRKVVNDLFQGKEAVVLVATPIQQPTKVEDVIHVRDDGTTQAISGRELHAFLDSRQDFSTWVKDRITRYDFILGVDYDVIHENMAKGSIGRPTIEYVFTVDAAKELAMVEGNERGKIARRYFIEVEKKFRTLVKQQAPSIPQTFAEALRLAASQAEELERQQKKIQEDAPKVTFATAVETSQSACLIGELAKMLCQNGVQTGEKRLSQWMRENGYLCNHGERYNQPTQRAMEMGLFKVKKQTWTKPSGVVMATTTTTVTGKGQIYFINKLLFNHQNQIPK